MKICLSIESAGHRLAAALVEDEKLLAWQALEKPHGAPGRLLPLIQETLRQAGVKPEVINLIAVDVGPGSFTGLRSGIAAAQGLAFGLSVPLVGISAFQALGNGARRAGKSFPLALLIDSRRAEPFTATLTHNLDYIELPRCLAADQLDGWRASQQNLYADRPELADSWQPIDPFDIALLARDEKFHLPAQPLYLREPEISRPKSG